MAPTEADTGLATTLEMGPKDVPGAFALSTEAGWNQTAEDWPLLVRLGRGFGATGPEGRLVATALALPYPSSFGWIGMVIVHGPFRRRGLATRLLDRSIADLLDRGLVPFLDATPAGQPVYQRMGFRPVDALTRWRGAGGGPPADPLSPLRDIGDIAELDRLAFGADRSAVLGDLLGRAGAVSLRDHAGDGYLLARTGRTATYIGPVVARETASARRLLEAGLAATSGPVTIDVPDRQEDVAALLSRRGFQPERPFARMALEHDSGYGDPGLIRAIAAPELG
jgi:GNAT superfamily N-acetyltransferase